MIPLGLARASLERDLQVSFVSKESRPSEKAGDIPALKLVTGHEDEETDRNKRPAANSNLEESFEPPLWDDPLM